MPACADDDESHQHAFALNPARHFSLTQRPKIRRRRPAGDHPLGRCPPLRIHPRLRQYGEATPRGALPRCSRTRPGKTPARRAVSRGHAQIEAARARHALATGQLTRLSDLGHLDAHAFALFLGLLGEALTVQTGPDDAVELQSSDGLLCISLEPLGADTRARVVTPAGIFSGRDHLISISRIGAAP